MSKKTLENIRLADGTRWEAAEDTYDDGADTYVLLKQIGNSRKPGIVARIDGDDLVFLGTWAGELPKAIERMRSAG